MISMPIRLTAAPAGGSSTPTDPTSGAAFGAALADVAESRVDRSDVDRGRPASPGQHKTSTIDKNAGEDATAQAAQAAATLNPGPLQAVPVFAATVLPATVQPATAQPASGQPGTVQPGGTPPAATGPVTAATPAPPAPGGLTLASGQPTLIRIPGPGQPLGHLTGGPDPQVTAPQTGPSLLAGVTPPSGATPPSAATASHAATPPNGATLRSGATPHAGAPLVGADQPPTATVPGASAPPATGVVATDAVTPFAAATPATPVPSAVVAGGVLLGAPSAGETAATTQLQAAPAQTAPAQAAPTADPQTTTAGAVPGAPTPTTEQAPATGQATEPAPATIQGSVETPAAPAGHGGAAGHGDGADQGRQSGRDGAGVSDATVAKGIDIERSGAAPVQQPDANPGTEIRAGDVPVVTQATAVTDTRAATTAERTGTTPAAHAAQIATHIVPLKKGPDGVHRLTIYLNPQDLGPISLVAEVRNGAIAVNLAGGTEAAREALQAALPDLQRDLEESGFGSTSLRLSQGGAEQGGAEQGGAAQERYAAPDRNADRQPQNHQHGQQQGTYQRPGNQPDASDPGTPKRGLDLHM